MLCKLDEYWDETETHMKTISLRISVGEPRPAVEQAIHGVNDIYNGRLETYCQINDAPNCVYYILIPHKVLTYPVNECCESEGSRGGDGGWK